MAKSAHDAGWSMLRNMLSYKSIATGGVMRVVPERYSSHSARVGCAWSEAVEK
jgi:transposase